MSTNKKRRNGARGEAGFSLIEIMVVVFIMGLLVTLVWLYLEILRLLAKLQSRR